MTSLFADVVGSTRLGERLQPDEVKALIGECVTRMSQAVEEFGGVVQAYQGDGICAYFGVAAARQDDPERAARAALRILDVVGEYGRDIAQAWGIEGFSVRVGVNTGVAAVGEVGAATPQQVALGDATNVAARLQAVAEPGTAVLGEETARRLGAKFELLELGGLTVKGRDGPVDAWRLVRAAPPTRGQEIVTPLIGRDGEVARLQTVLADLEAGRGGVVVIVGDDGIGKTRLLADLRARAGDRAIWLEGTCLSYAGDFAYWPFVELLRGWLGVEEGDAAIALRAKLRARLSALLGPRTDLVLPVFARLLATRAETSEPLDPAAVEGSVALWLDALAASRPVVVALEDVHWLDEPCRRLAESLLAATDRSPLLLVVTSRNEPGSEGHRLRMTALGDYGHRTAVETIGPLSAEDSATLLGRLLPSLDDSAAAELTERAEGNPFYLEQLLQALVESGGFVRHRTLTISSAARQSLPPALEGLLVARIDRLDAGARRVVQAGAVLGRTFGLGLVERMGELEDAGRDLPALMRAEILRETRRFPELELAFTHRLLQEAALSTLTRARYQDLHARAAAAYEALAGGAADDQLEILAHHYAQSNDAAKACEYLLRAADRAETLGALEQAADLRVRAQACR